MTGYFRMLVAVVALAALPGLSGCGGGGGSTAAPAAQMPREPAPEPMAEPAPEPMAEPAAGSEPGQSGFKDDDLWGLGGPGIYRAMFNPFNRLPTNVATSEERTRHYGYASSFDNFGSYRNTRDGIQVSALPDGSGVRVTRSYTGNEPRAWDDDLAFESGGGPVSDLREDLAVFGRIMWDGGNGGNWSAWGWWLEFRGADFIANAPLALKTGAVVAAVFADGPEFRSEVAWPDRPLSARYRGSVAGVFGSLEAREGSIGHISHTTIGFPADTFGFPADGVVSLSERVAIARNAHGGPRAQGSVTTGEFMGSIDLALTYNGLIRTGALRDQSLSGDIRISRMDGMRTDIVTGATEKVVREFGASGGLSFGFAGSTDNIERDGRFEFSPTVVSGFEDTVLSGFGDKARTSLNSSIRGRFSSMAAADGSPRSVAGIMHLRVEDEQVWHDFMGAFLAPRVE